ncbi:MAG TPA: hypothetical protein VN625_09420, partial [Desulfuromonadaceae bacterium]|nr:hypothetical protein [Desulfuromonadaceae bacterium]
MSNYLYEAVDASGLRSKGALDVMDQSEALRRIKEMGLFPTKVVPEWTALSPARSRPARRPMRFVIRMPEGRVRPMEL